MHHLSFRTGLTTKYYEVRVDLRSPQQNLSLPGTRRTSARRRLQGPRFFDMKLSGSGPQIKEPRDLGISGPCAMKTCNARASFFDIGVQPLGGHEPQQKRKQRS